MKPNKTAPRAKAAKPLPPFVSHCLALLLPLGPVVPRRMFGGWGLFLDGVMIALIARDRLYFKADEQTAGRFAAAGAEAFTYQRRSDQGRSRPVALSYWRAPEGSLEDPPEALRWGELAVAAARRCRNR